MDRSDKVNHEQINPIFIVIARLSRYFSHLHNFLLFKIISEAGDVVSMSSKGVAEEESD